MDDIFIRKVNEGDTDAFRYFIKQYQDMAFSIAVSVVKDEFIAQEVAQDAFVKAYQKLSTFNKQSAFSTWFYRIVTNEALMRLRKMKKELLSFGVDWQAVASEDVSLMYPEENEQAYLVNEALQKIPPKESLVLRLFYLQEESVREVGNITGWSEANVKTILHRARKQLLIVLQQLMKKTY